VVATTIADCRIGVGTIGDGILLENVAIFGETNNVGNPTRPLYEQGTSRPRPWDPASPIYGMQTSLFLHRPRFLTGYRRSYLGLLWAVPVRHRALPQL
jgi:hypothetical protein